MLSTCPSLPAYQEDYQRVIDIVSVLYLTLDGMVAFLFNLNICLALTPGDYRAVSEGAVIAGGNGIPAVGKFEAGAGYRFYISAFRRRRVGIHFSAVACRSINPFIDRTGNSEVSVTGDNKHRKGSQYYHYCG